jgi:glycogenin glucosyltransferase
VCEKNFDKVVFAPLLKSTDFVNLSLLGRPELDVTFSKFHVFNSHLFPYERVAFLDADVLVLQPIDDIFDYVSDPESVFAAAPDIGWPDCFNSGVFVTKPSTSLYMQVLSYSTIPGVSFDGGDQGLLNSFFSQWSDSFGNSKRAVRLPFIFNVTPSAFYSYLPAFVHFETQIRAVHFIGYHKPWRWSRNSRGDVISS